MGKRSPSKSSALKRLLSSLDNLARGEDGVQAGAVGADIGQDFVAHGWMSVSCPGPQPKHQRTW
jgi:hypothetical protein